MEGVILSSWDYIMGPQIERLWLTSNNNSTQLLEVPIDILKDFNITKHCKSTKQACYTINQVENHNLKIYSIMCGQLLLGEVDTCKTFDESASRFYISDYKILVCVVFRMRSWFYSGTAKEIKNVCLCLGTIFKREDLSCTLDNQFVLDIHLRKAASILQKSQVPDDSVMGELSNVLNDLTLLLDTLHHANLNSVQIHPYMPYQDYLASDILPRAIVSHLQTSGHTTVLGSSEFKIHQVIHVLSTFSSKKELSTSLPVIEWSLKSNIQGLYIQGTIKNTEKECEDILEKAFKESMPLTVIDTDLCKVWQTWPFHDNIEKNRYFCVVAETGCLVPQLLDDLSFSEKNQGDCQSEIEIFFTFLMVKSVSLIKAVHSFRQTGKFLTKKELMTMFSLSSVGDLHILLGCAEKIKPGIRTNVI